MPMYKCHDRKSFKPTLEVQNGWTTDGRRNMMVIPFTMARECMYDHKKTDVRCTNCYEGTK